MFLVDPRGILHSRTRTPLVLAHTGWSYVDPGTTHFETGVKHPAESRTVMTRDSE